ncbi:MAG: alpha/beta fold hydrolase [Clostridiales bacterium]|nr:alpha/beta fold hydrolase [Clostridiales bacterium]
MKTGVLLLHGFAGAPEELAPLKKHLEICGYTVSSPVLAGHGGTPGDLGRSKRGDWIRAALNAAMELRQHCDSIAVVGFSMGGLIALNLYHRIAIRLLFLVNTPVFYWDAMNILTNLRTNFSDSFRFYVQSALHSPIPALVEFDRLLRSTKLLLPGVRCPVVIMQALDDDTVQARSADYLYHHITGVKTLRKYKTGGHLVFHSPMAPELCFTIEKTIEADCAD